MSEIKQESKKRQVARKVSIKSILEGSYVKEEGWTPNYIILKDGTKLSRANIIATVISHQIQDSMNYKGIIIDDGSGNINLRQFEESSTINNFNIGDFVLVIGRPREFGNERYLIPDLIKKIENKNWIELRKLELSKNKKEDKNQVEIYNDTIEEENIYDPGNILQTIKKLDSGEGANLGDVIENSKNKDAEKIINRMIMGGELFEIRPGMIKVLE